MTVLDMDGPEFAAWFQYWQWRFLVTVWKWVRDSLGMVKFA